MAKAKNHPVFESNNPLDWEQTDVAIRALTVQKHKAGAARRAALDAAVTELYAHGRLFLTEAQFDHMIAALKGRARRVGVAKRTALEDVIKELEASWCSRYPEQEYSRGPALRETVSQEYRTD